MKALLLLCLFPLLTMAQQTAVVPQGISVVPPSNIGNTASFRCQENMTNHLRLIVQPSCYGGNLRSATGTLDPHGDLVKMNLQITNSGSTQTVNVQFPPELTWPDYYGQACIYDEVAAAAGNYNVTCERNGVNVSYTCNFQDGGTYQFHDRLYCTRVADPAGEDDYNKTIRCSFYFNWAGESLGAAESYTRIMGSANCGITDPAINYAGEVVVDPISGATSEVEIATRGLLVIDISNIVFNRFEYNYNPATHEIVPVEGTSRSTLDVLFQQGTKLLTVPEPEIGFDQYETCLTVKPLFQGSNQFCGSYYSPIMLFFGKQLPKFMGKSMFPLRTEGSVFHWPEANSNGYFLAQVSEKSENIVSAKQLFGEDKDHKNGFEKLRFLDKNNNLKIDAGDPIFSSLRLWNDKNGNGISEKGEVFKLPEMGVESISINYAKDPNKFKRFGRRAEARESSTFVYKKKGKKVTGMAYDVWFGVHSASEKIEKRKSK